MPKLVSLWKSKYFKLALLILLFIAAALIIMAMWLGNEAGQFVIRVQTGDVEKSVSVTEDYTDKNSFKPSIEAKGMENMNDYSPEYFLQTDYEALRTLTKEPGMTNYEEGSLYIYTFYIVNTSKSGGVGVSVELNYSHVTNHMDEIVRVLTYYETYNVSDPEIYQKPDSLERARELNPELERIDYTHYILTPNPFYDSSSSTQGVVFKNQHINIGYGENNYVKYSVIFWLEGEDPDSEYYGNDLFGGTIKFDMKISVSM